ncbi:MAG TPA: right-handed parallel beta-helix repeat-containing protein [Planctomycetota bacterium]|nr:right-handed parallel beta-helix repeat-containing protein [Planctomycetota bacterium]
MNPTTTLACAALILTCCSAVAAEYHVATHGDDGAPGGADRPWRSVSKAVGAARAGDTVHIHGGTYAFDRASVAASGTATAPITFTAAQGESPVIQSSSFDITDRQWIVIRGLTFRGPKQLPASWQDLPTRVMEEPGLRITPGESWSTREAKVRRKYATFMGILDHWSSGQTKGISVHRSHNITLIGNTVSHHTRGVLVGEASSSITIVGNTVRYCQWGIQSWAPSGSVAISDSLVQGNTAEQCWDHGIFIYGRPQRTTVTGNTARNHAVNGIGLQAGAQDCALRGNHIESGGFYSETMRAPGASAISVYGLGSGCVVDANYCAYWQDWTHYDGNGIIIDTTSNHVLVTNNLCYRNMGSGITQTLSPGSSIINNTCVENGWNTTHAYNGVGIRFAKTVDVGATVANNILCRNSRGGLMAADLFRHARVDANVYDLVPGTPVMRNGYSAGYATIEATRAATGYETRGCVGDPRFVDAAAGDYRLTAGSIAEAAADSTLSPLKDRVGLRRGAQPDCGAYERLVDLFDELRVDFKPATSPTLPGWMADGGEVYGDRAGGFIYGWSADISADARDRNLDSNQLRDALLQVQRWGGAPTWELAVRDGTYQVRLVCGDAGYTNSEYRMDVEGVRVVDARPTSSNRFCEGAVTVEVRDGRLTLSNAAGSINNKVCYLEIIRVPVADG